MGRVKEERKTRETRLEHCDDDKGEEHLNEEVEGAGTKSEARTKEDDRSDARENKYAKREQKDARTHWPEHTQTYRRVAEKADVEKGERIPKGCER